MKVIFRFSFSISLCFTLLGLLACVPTNGAHSSPSGATGVSALAVSTVDQTATAAFVIIETALAATPLPGSNSSNVGAPLSAADAAQTVAAQDLATAVAATLTAQLSATPTANVAATQTTAAQSMGTAVAETLTAQPTSTPNIGATQTALAGNVATSVAATLTAQPSPTPTQTPLPVAPPTPTLFTRPVNEGSGGALRIAFAHGDIGDSDLRVADVETGAVYTIAGQACDEAEPAWSPDNAQIVYHADCAESYDIYRVNSDGSSATRLTFTPDIDEREPEYSPDGSQLIYRANPREATETNAVGELWVMDNNGSGQRALGVIGRAPAWSPDGSRIAFMSDRTGRWNIYLYAVGTGRTVQLTNCDTNCRWPAWAPNGQTIVFNTSTKPTNTEAEAIWVVPATGGNPTRIATGRNPGRPSWSNTGLIAFNSADGIEYMRADGRERTLLITDKLNWAPHWSK